MSDQLLHPVADSFEIHITCSCGVSWYETGNPAECLNCGKWWRLSVRIEAIDAGDDAQDDEQVLCADCGAPVHPETEQEFDLPLCIEHHRQALEDHAYQFSEQDR